MSDDIEAAAKALALQFDLTYLRERNTCASEAEARTAGWLAVARHALAHAARGEGGPPPWHAPCVLCGHRQSAHNTDTGPCSKCGCDCAAFRPTPPPATGEAKWPEIRDSGGRTDFALTPATGEAGTRGEVEIRVDERERCAKWHDERAEASGNERAAWWHKDCAAALRALPEAREGGGK